MVSIHDPPAGPAAGNTIYREEDSDEEGEAARNYKGYDNEVSNEIRNLARTFSHSSGVQALNDEDDGEIKSVANLELMRTLTGMSQIAGEIPMATNGAGVSPKLDPESPEFDSKFWVMNMRKLMDSDVDFYRPAKLGLAYKDLRAYGEATDLDYQSTFDNLIVKLVHRQILKYFRHSDDSTFDILKPMDGLIKAGELTVVLGRPGSGCSTFLKAIANQTYGFNLDEKSIISYDGITPEQIEKHFRGEVTYCAETETHFPHLSVKDTLEFVARMKTPRNRPPGVSREAYADHMAAMVMATYGLSHTKDTKVGNDFIRGVSGGERKRVSIAEVALSRSAIQCWDNSTRGLDAATALEFLKSLKVSATVLEATPLIAIYQCSQDSYDLFDNVILLYEGYQIFYGKAKDAKKYFLEMGYTCPQRQTTADFLTSLTNPAERVVKEGFEHKVPRTPIEFYEYWNNSPEKALLVEDIDEYLSAVNSEKAVSEFSQAHRAKQSKNLSRSSPMTVSFFMQVKYVMFRNFRRTRGDPSITLFNIIGHFLIGLILSSIFYNMLADTHSFYSRTASLFFAVLFNAFSSVLEIFTLYEARPIVEKHKKYALYHPSADALASIITEMPTKLFVCITFNLTLYFMVNFRRDPGHFFFYLLINFTSTLAMSHLFRTIGASTKTLSQAMTPASILLLALTIFTGFVIPTPHMHGWCRWINYIDPIAYAFEALVANEFSGRKFVCSQFVPTGGNYTNIEGEDNYICSSVGAQIGSHYVNGEDYINDSFRYYNSHKWRNWGIIIAYVVFFLATYVIICEFNKGAMQKGEILLFQQKDLKKLKKQKRSQDVESSATSSGAILEKVLPEEAGKESATNSDSDALDIPKQSDIFHWRNLKYEVKIKKENRVILNSIDGWVKPGQVTALMGASGAGKTTLLNALSERLTSGEITSGVRMVNGHSTDSSFQRSIGYVQQQDLHLTTSTVREALKFSAYLRQPKSVPKKEKDAYVDEIIALLEMEKYANAVVGVAGEGLNVEQRKRLTIGVELVAKPKLLVFLDEPTSGLDSQTAWSICKLIRKLADHGQSILCTIHQPSAILLQEFDRLLFLQKGGQTVYFGDLGKNCQTLIDYFEKYGGHPCPPEANPAEWMLEVIGAAPGSKATQDYFEVWRNSSEFAEVNRELDEMENELVKLPVDKDPENLKEFAAPFWLQYLIVTKRVFEQYWRTPSYTYSKVSLCLLSALFNGFAFFKADKSMQGLQNQMFSVFMFLVVFITLVQQYLPHFVSQRDLYEVRERPSKTFSWQAFIAAQITVEIPWQIGVGTVAFFCWYYPIGLYENAVPTNTVHERGALMWITIVLFYVYSSTMGQLCISFIELADNAADLSTILFTILLGFCGVLSAQKPLPGFWIFMYRCNPFTYCVSAMLSIGLANSDVVCAANELAKFAPLEGYTCGEYMAGYMSVAGGYLVDENSTTICQFCSMASTNVFLKEVSASYEHRGRDIGIFSAFIFVDMIGTVFFYWLTRVPKGSKHKMK